LERSVASLQKKLTKDTEIHRADNVRIMQENVTLIKEINDLRRELKITRSKLHDLETSMGTNRVGKGGKSAGPRLDTGPTLSDPSATQSGYRQDVEAPRIIEMQKTEIRRLREQMLQLEEQASRRPPSGGRLPPMVLTQ